jgi:hypothetical protein
MNHEPLFLMHGTLRMFHEPLSLEEGFMIRGTRIGIQDSVVTPKGMATLSSTYDP